MGCLYFVVFSPLLCLTLSSLLCSFRLLLLLLSALKIIYLSPSELFSYIYTHTHHDEEGRSRGEGDTTLSFSFLFFYFFFLNYVICYPWFLSLFLSLCLSDPFDGCMLIDIPVRIMVPTSPPFFSRASLIDRSKRFGFFQARFCPKVVS